MSQNILVITEGKVTEPTIFERVLPKYGFIVENLMNVSTSKINDENNTFEESIYSDRGNLINGFKRIEYKHNNDRVVIIQGNRNRIKDLFFKKEDLKEEVYYERKVLGTREKFSLIFIVYDIDHSSYENLIYAFNRFSDERDNGLLILSCPCIEALAEVNYDRIFEGSSFKAYKAILNVFHEKNNKMNALDYIVNNFNKIMINYLDKNCKEFDEHNIMEHPKKIIEFDRKYNMRTGSTKDDFYLYIRYYSTVIYVIIATIKKLTVEIDNYKVVRDFFKKYEE